MIIQHNIMALNSYNKLSTNNSAVQKNLEKLSSGYRINRAGDDAAGLAISEKMRAQITGLERAKLNAQDGISLVQTAEGALTEVHSMLNRLVELGTESANGIYQAEDREKIQSEVTQILEEIDRIAESTNFNGIKLLDGSLDSKKVDEIAKNNGTQVVMPTGTLNSTGVSGQMDPGLVRKDDVKVNELNVAKANDGIAVADQDTAGNEKFVGSALTSAAGDAVYTEINWTAADGTAKQVIVTGTVGTASKAGLDIAVALGGAGTASDKYTVSGDIDAFKETFAATKGAADTQVTIEAKAGKTGYTGLEVKFGHAADADAAKAGATAVAAAATSTVGYNAGTKISVTTVDLEAGDTIEFGGKTFTFAAAATGAENEVVIGADDKSTATNLATAMKKAGLTAANDGLTGDVYVMTAPGASTVVGAKEDAVKGKTVVDFEHNTGTNASVATTDNAKYDGVTISYKNAAGEEKSFTIYEESVTSFADDEMGAGIADIINGIDKAGGTFGIDDADNMKEFKELFNISGNAGTLTIEAKEGGTKGASLIDIRTKTSAAAASSADRITDASDGTAVKAYEGTVDAQGSGVSIDLSGAKAGNTLTIGDKTYEFYAAGGDATKVKSGNVAVELGTGATAPEAGAKTVENLIDALKKNGVDAEAKSVAYVADAAGSKEGPSTTILITTPVGSSSAELGSWKEATAQEMTFNAADFGFDNARMDGVSFTYEVDGQRKSFTLYESGVGSADPADLAKSIVATIKGSPDAGTRLNPNVNDDQIKEFRDLFDIKADDSGNLTVTAKEKGVSGTKFVGINTKQGDAGSTDMITDASAGNTVTAKKVTNAQNAGIAVDMTGTIVGDKINIGGRTYEIAADENSEVSNGSVLVAKGATDADTINNLVEALNQNGVKAEKVEGEDKLLITDLDAISKTQEGMEISSGNKDMRVEQTASTKNEATVKLADTNAGNYTLKLSYTDEAGKSQTADIDYKLVAGESSGSNAADAIKDAISKDDTLRKLFDVESKNGELTITAKADGTKGAKVTGVQTSDSKAGAISNFNSTDGIEQGKTISMTNGNNFAVGDTVEVGGKTYEFVKQGESAKDGNVAVNLADNNTLGSMENLRDALKGQGIEAKVGGTNKNPTLYIADDQKYAVEEGKGEGGLTLQVGDTSDDFNKVTVYVADMSSKGLGLDNLKVTDQGLASESIDKVKAAIEKVSVSRGNLGALQNRLEHTINNLSTTTENMTAAESRIRDTDMAKEMMNFTKNNVLVQAAQAMLSQANQQPQQVLQLLR